MIVSLVKKALFPEEFIIDQQPEPEFVAEPTSGGEAPAGDGGETVSASRAVLDAVFRSGRSQDLLSQMEALLLEQERLAEKARLLEMKGAGSDEFGKFAKQVLPFMDNFAHMLDMAREHPPSEEVTNWLKSIESLYFRMTDLLETYDLRFINSMGKVVNLDFHEVIDYRFTDQFPHNTVIKEAQKGVVFRGRLIRDAKVVVACNPNSESSR